MTDEGIDSSMLTGSMEDESNHPCPRRSYQTLTNAPAMVMVSKTKFPQRPLHTIIMKLSSKESKVVSTTYLGRGDEPASQQLRYNK